MILEICANSVASATLAQQAGAHRLELCTELHVGGVTPSYGMLKEIRKAIRIPVFVLIRPRSGNFSYSEAEFNTMKHNIELCKSLGFNGIVSGVLKADNTIDVERTKALINLAEGLEFTFHRAFDIVPNPKQAIQTLAEIGVDRVLTSGQAQTAEKGLKMLTALKNQTNGKLKILPGSGINSSNIALFKGFKEVHTSASKPVNEPSIPFFNMPRTVCNLNEIKAILNTFSNETTS